MRNCPGCDQLTDHNDVVCHKCRYLDPGWAEHLSYVRRRANKPAQPMLQLSLPIPNVIIPSIIEYPTILLSPFSDSGELGFHLANIQSQLADNSGATLRVPINLSEWAYTWDYGDETDTKPADDVYLPPNVPPPALAEIGRFIQVLLANGGIDLRLVLPPQQHAVTQFLLKSGIFSSIPVSSRDYISHMGVTSREPGCDTVLVPLTYVGKQTHGQLSNEFHDRFTQLLDAGVVLQPYRSSLRDVVMEAAANADQWGDGGWIIAFLRQEKGGKGSFGHRNQVGFSALADTHLYLHVLSIGPTLAQTTGLSTEWEAANEVIQGFSSRESGGGLGMPRIIEIVIKETIGTIMVSSGGYSRIITPDGLAHEFSSAGSHYLPGVHLCAVVPLAHIADLRSGREDEPALIR